MQIGKLSDRVIRLELSSKPTLVKYSSQLAISEAYKLADAGQDNGLDGVLYLMPDSQDAKCWYDYLCFLYHMYGLYVK